MDVPVRVCVPAPPVSYTGAPLKVFIVLVWSAILELCFVGRASDL